MAERYFSPEEVEALIPRLTEVMERMMAAHAESGAARDRLRAERQRVELSGGGVIDRAAWREDSGRMERGARVVQEGLAAIAALGGEPKDLSMGLVDFPHVREGQVVNLCWKHGERAIRFWHGLDEGFAGRKPL